MSPFETIIALIYIWYKKLEGDKKDNINWFALLLGFGVLFIFLNLNIRTFTNGSLPLFLSVLLFAIWIVRFVFHGFIDFEEITRLKKVKKQNLIFALIYCLISIAAYLWRFTIQNLLNI